MTDRVLRMTTGHLVRWTLTYAVFVGFWTWYVVTATSTLLQVLGIVLGLLALRGAAGSVVALVRRPTLAIRSDVLTVTQVVGARDALWADCSEFRSVSTMTGGHVRYQEGSRRRSLPAGFADTDRRLSAGELAEVLNRARAAALSEPGASEV